MIANKIGPPSDNFFQAAANRKLLKNITTFYFLFKKTIPLQKNYYSESAKKLLPAGPFNELLRRK
jgi:hypothetical protein